MSALEEYISNPLQAYDLLLEIRKPTLRKTKIDVTYYDIKNWESNELLFNNPTNELNKQSAYSYVEYAWLKVVQALKKYGFTHDEIKVYLEDMFPTIPIEALKKSAMESIAELRSLSPEKAEVLSRDYKDEFWLEVERELNMKPFEIFIILCIYHSEDTFLVLNRDNVNDYYVHSTSILSKVPKETQEVDYRQHLCKPHVSINLFEIMSPFIGEHNSLQSGIKQVLTNDEHKIITEIRKRYDKVKSLKVIFKDGIPKMLEVENTRKVQMETEIMNLINGSGYEKIELYKENGKIVSMGRIRKIKL